MTNFAAFIWLKKWEILKSFLIDFVSGRELTVIMMWAIKEHIFNIVDSEHYVFKDGSNFFIQANFEPDKKDYAIDLVKSEIDQVKFNILPDELNKAKKKIKSRFASNAETVSDIGETIGYYMTVCNDLSLVSDYLNIVDNITIDDLKETAKSYLNIQNAVISVLLPEWIL